MVAYNSVSNEYLVIWGQSVGGIKGQRVDAAGVPIGSTIFLSSGQFGAGNPAVAFNPFTNQYLVQWDAFANFPSNADIFARFINADGTFGGPIVTVTTADDFQVFGSVTVNTITHQYLLAWWDQRNSATTFSDIFGQLVNGDGSLAGTNIPLSTLPLQDEILPAVAYSKAANQYLAIWLTQTASGNNIVGRIFNQDGTPAGNEFPITTHGQAQVVPALAVDPDTGIGLAVWPDERNQEASGVDIFAQLLFIRPSVTEVAIDIKPGGFPNPITQKSQGKIPVAVLSSTTFSAPETVDTSSLTFGRTGDEQSLAMCNSTPENVNGDSLPDLVCHFNVQQTGFQLGDTAGILKGKTLDHTPLHGVDAVVVIQ